jgi:small subunit ribosomal protein S7
MRRRRALKREVDPDPKFNNIIVAKLINNMMKWGQKSVAEKIFYNSLDLVKEKINDDPLKVFFKAIDNVKPTLELRARRVGGATYQIPVEVESDRRVSLAIKWMVSFARARKGMPMAQRLANEIIDAYNNTGSAIKKKIDTHKMAEANRAFAHFKW